MKKKNAQPHCPLCLGKKSSPYFADNSRSYLLCSGCQLVFVPERFWLSSAEEKAIYDLHQNDTHDPGYRKFLSRLTLPLNEKLGPNKQGLDFGCGPGPALAAMLSEQGHQLELFDPFYQQNPAAFDKQYDFICATEVVEHLRTPHKEFTTLFKLLKKGGWLGLMTKLVIDQQSFSQWHYIRDLSHICFYSRTTFEYLAQRFEATVSFPANDVILLQKR